MTLERPLNESETVKLFKAAIDFYMSSSKPWEVAILEPLLDSGAFTSKEKTALTAQLETAKREYKGALLREQLAKILVGEDMVKDAEDHVQRMGAPKSPPIQTPFQTNNSVLDKLTARDIEELMRKQNEYSRQDYLRNQAQSYGTAIQAIKNPWNTP